MSLYRTNSDRGLWKKYQKEAVQHFHKPHYLDKKKPVVTYSQLDLGERHRSHSIGSRQSNLNLDLANQRFDRAYSQEHLPRRNLAKSAPASRAATPTRVKNKYRAQNGTTNGHNDQTSAYLTGNYNSLPYQRPKTSNSQYSQDTAFSAFAPDADEEDRLSFESRSLTAFSNFSGRDSVLTDTNHMAFRYPYASEPMQRDYTMDRPNEPDRPNPFVRGSEVSQEADTVVQAFMRSSFAANQYNGQQLYANQPLIADKYADSVSSSVLSSEPHHLPRVPGRIEDLNSPTSPYNQRITNGPRDELPLLLPTGSLSSRQLVAQAKQSFLADEQANQPELQKPKGNKYLRPEHRWSGPPASAQIQPQRVNDNQSDVTSDTVKSFEAPQMHHAELVTLRQDSSSSSDDSDGANPPAHMILQSPMAPLPVSVTTRPEPVVHAAPQVFSPQTTYTNKTGTDSYHAQPSSPKSSSSENTDSKLSEERNFQDPARSNFQDMAQFQEPPKKKGFLSGLFRKGSKGKKKGRRPGSDRRRPHSEYMGGNSSDHSRSSSDEDGDEDHKTLAKKAVSQPSLVHEKYQAPNEDQVKPVTVPYDPQPLGIPDVSASKPAPVQSGGKQYENIGPSEPRPLERKRSMSKPTDLDELMRLQEEEERTLREEELKTPVPDLDHQLQTTFPSPNTPLYQNTQQLKVEADELQEKLDRSPVHDLLDTTQEIDVDEALGMTEPEEDPEEEAKKIEWPKSRPVSDKAILNEPVEMHPEFERIVDTPPKKKPGFFNFGKKKKPSKPFQFEQEDINQPPVLPNEPRFDEYVEPVIDIVRLSQPEPPAIEGEHAQPVPAKIQPTAEEKKDQSSSSAPSSRKHSPSPERRQKSGLKNMFRSPGLKSSSRKERPKSQPFKAGNVEPVDVSHLIDDNDIVELGEQEHTSHPSEPETTHYEDTKDPESHKSLPNTDNDDVSSRDNIFESSSEAPKDADSTSVSTQDHIPDRSRRHDPRRQSGGFGNFFNFGSKPRSKSIDRRKPAPQNMEQSPSNSLHRKRYNSHSSMERPRDSPSPQSKRHNSFGGRGSRPQEAPPPPPESHGDSEPARPRNDSTLSRHKSNPGLSSIFSLKPSSRRHPPPDRMRESPQNSRREQENVPENQTPRRDQSSPVNRQTQSLPRKKPKPQGGGFGSLFSLAPKSRPPPRRQEPSTQNAQPYDNEPHNSRSLPPKKREPKGFSSLFGPSPARKSGRRPPQRQTLAADSITPDRNRAYGPETAPPESRRPLPSSQTTPNLSTSRPNLDEATPADRPVTNSPPEHHRARTPDRTPPFGEERRSTPDTRQEEEPRSQATRRPESPQSIASSMGRPQRQMGRRSGGFRKQPANVYRANHPDYATPQQDQNPPSEVNDPATPQSHLQDLFAENARKPPLSMSPPRRRQDSASPEDRVDAIEVDRNFDGNRQGHPLRKSTSQISRTESYRQAKNTPLRNNSQQGLPPRNAPSHSSMPRLAKRQPSQPRAGDPGADPNFDTRSLGRSRQQKGRPEDPCSLM